MKHTVFDSDSDCLESIHKISDAAMAKNRLVSINFQTRLKDVKNTLKHNQWLLSNYSSINLYGENQYQNELVVNFLTKLYLFVLLNTPIKNCLDLFEF